MKLCKLCTLYIAVIANTANTCIKIICTDADAIRGLQKHAVSFRMVCYKTYIDIFLRYIASAQPDN